MSESSDFLIASGLHKSFGGLQAVDGVSFSIGKQYTDNS